MNFLTKVRIVGLYLLILSYSVVRINARQDHNLISRRETLVALKTGGTNAVPNLSKSFKSKKVELNGKSRENVNNLERFYDKDLVSDFFLIDSRLGFIRKVYAIFGAQVLTTLLMIFATIRNRSFQSFLLQNMKLLSSVPQVISFGIVGLLSFSETLRQTFPINLFFVAALTIFESLSLTTISLFIPVQLVILSLVYTLLAFGFITALTFQKKITLDYQQGRSFLLISALTTIIGSVLNAFFFQVPLIENSILLLTAITFAGFIWYDTKRIMTGKKTKNNRGRNRSKMEVNDYYSSKDYVLAAMELYMDFLGMLRTIMIILMKLQQEEKKSKSSRAGNNQSDDNESFEFYRR
jgi:FtsH-binding integral membrane protein